MQELFTTLSHAVGGSLGLALAASTLWGVLSIVLSPCHLSSIPLIVGFIDGQGRISTARSFYISSLFAGGILITIAALGAATAAGGRMMGDIGAWGNYAVAAIFFLVGLYLLGVIDTLSGRSLGYGDQATRAPGGSRARTGFWNCARPLYVRFYGPGAGSGIPFGVQ